MPLPQKIKGERKAKFLGRCMKSAIMKREFPKIKQRIAICFSQYRRAK